MSISHQHKCVFVHIPKTAGTTIKNILKIEDLINIPHHKFGYIVSQNLLSKDILNAYFKFSVVRNPYDRVVSLFFHFRKYSDPFTQNKLQSFGVDSIKWLHRLNYQGTQISYISGCEKIDLDYIGRFESLSESWNIICDRLSLSPFYKLLLKKTHFDHNVKRDYSDYRKYYNEDSKKFVGKEYQEDLDTFKYIF